MAHREVFRLARVQDAILTSPFGPTQAHSRWLRQRETAYCAFHDHDAPAAGCQCGLWAAADLVSVARFVRDWKHYDSCRAAEARSFIGSPGVWLQRQMQLAGMPGQRAAELRSMTRAQVLDHVREADWTNFAIVRARVDGGRDRRSYEHTPGIWPGCEQFLSEVEDTFGVSGQAAIDWSARLNHPEGFRRYKRLRVTAIWLDRRWEGRHDEMRVRYRCDVHLRSAGQSGDWLDGFLESNTAAAAAFDALA